MAMLTVPHMAFAFGILGIFTSLISSCQILLLLLYITIPLVICFLLFDLSLSLQATSSPSWCIWPHCKLFLSPFLGSLPFSLCSNYDFSLGFFSGQLFTGSTSGNLLKGFSPYLTQLHYLVLCCCCTMLSLRLTIK